MLEIIGLAIGAFVGYLISDFLAALDPIKAAIKQGITTGRDKLMQFVGSFSQSPLVPIGVLLVLVIIVFWLVGFSSAMLIGVVAGVIYSEEIGRLPFISGLADTIKQKISGKISGPK